MDPTHIPGISSWGLFTLISSESSTSEPAEDFKGFKKTRDFGDFQVLSDIISYNQVLSSNIVELCHRF